MKPFNNLIIIVISCLLLLSPCLCNRTLGRNLSNHFQCIDTERDALLQFKNGITEDDCGLLTSWEPHTDCCQWTGVVCSNLTRHVIKLRLVDCPLEGKVSPSIGELKHLEHLNLSNNIFHGEIPHQLGNLSNLITLDLYYAYYDIHVQSLSWITRLTLLTYLDLSAANLSQVMNWMTITNNLPSLRVLCLRFFGLSQEIPLSISYVNSSTTLQKIILSGNSFKNGSIFRWLFNMPKITTHLLHLDLSSNDFEGPIPNEIGNLQSLSYLSLSHNAFQGSVFKIINKLYNLEQLHLGNNAFNDKLSDVIDSLVQSNNKTLQVLDLRSNRFWGEIPDNIGSLFFLRELYLGGNQHKGEINSGIRQLTMLETLDISSNSLEGTITQTFFLNLVRLRVLGLSDNPKLAIRIVEGWISPFTLDVIKLRSCKLGPRFPRWLHLQTNFSYFDISNTGINDRVPDSFWNSLSSNLLYLNMSYNKFYGTIPKLSHILYSFAIDLSSNMFEGVAPSGFANSQFLYLNDNRFSNCSSLLCPETESSLVILDLSDNLFFEELPNCWASFINLRSLHLENNNFSGRIPNSIGSMLGLQYLHLSNNSISRPFPIAFTSLKSLVILNLGHNLFTGYLPSWIGDASQTLGALILRENHFIGEMPEGICRLKILQILDVGVNHISGLIPNCIGDFMGMMEGITNPGLDFEANRDVDAIAVNEDYGLETYRETTTVSWKREERRFKETIKFVKLIDLSSNEMRGEIPNGISILNGLKLLVLSKNKLSGKIPLEIGNLTVLELLDLSNNHLTGKIPTSLAKVTTLGILDVSNNNLSGQIPVSTQLQSFDASQYAGNPGLCGAPLSSCSKDRSPSNSICRKPNGCNTSVQGKDYDFGFFLGLYISVVLGFIVGFWGVFGTLVIKSSWRHAYFRLIDNIKNRIM